MNCFSNLSINNSPIVIMIYNLSISLCMQHKYIGFRQLTNTIDVYFSSSIKSLRFLRSQGLK